MRELVNLCFSLEEESLCLRESFFRGLLRSNALLCHWLLSTCCSRRPTHTSKETNSTAIRDTETTMGVQPVWDDLAKQVNGDQSEYKIKVNTKSK